LSTSLGWEGNRRSGVALATRRWSTYWLTGLWKGDEHPAYAPSGVWHSFTFTFKNFFCEIQTRSPPTWALNRTGLYKFRDFPRMSQVFLPPWKTPQPWKFTVVSLCAQLTRDLSAIAKFLVTDSWHVGGLDGAATTWSAYSIKNKHNSLRCACQTRVLTKNSERYWHAFERKLLRQNTQARYRRR